MPAWGSHNSWWNLEGAALQHEANHLLVAIDKLLELERKSAADRPAEPSLFRFAADMAINGQLGPIEPLTPPSGPDLPAELHYARLSCKCGGSPLCASCNEHG